MRITVLFISERLLSRYLRLVLDLKLKRDLLNLRGFERLTMQITSNITLLVLNGGILEREGSTLLTISFTAICFRDKVKIFGKDKPLV